MKTWHLWALYFVAYCSGVVTAELDRYGAGWWFLSSFPGAAMLVFWAMPKVRR